MGLVIDTSAIVDLERSDAAIDSLSEMGAEPVVVPAIVVAELLAGVGLARSAAVGSSRRAKIDALTARVPIVDFGRGIAAHWAELFVALQRRGGLIPANDLAVAATATFLGFDLLAGARDERHFRRVPGLGVRTLSL